MGTRTRNTVLEGLLREYGLSHEELAEEVNRVAPTLLGITTHCTDRHVRRWVSGESAWPWGRYLVLLGSIFGRTPREMGFVPRGSSSTAPAPPPANHSALEPAPPHPRKSRSPSDEEDAMRRRTFAAAAVATVLGIDQLPTRGRFGTNDLIRIRDTVGRLDAHFSGLGGGAVHQVAVDYLHRLHRTLDQCTFSDRLERGLHRAVADVAACAAWSAHDCGWDDTVAPLRNEALQAALMSRESGAVTRAWSDLAASAEANRRPAEAARVNRAALADRHVRDHPRLAALLHARLADCLAQTGDLPGMGRHLAAAERAFDRTEDAPPETWLAFLDPSELSGLTALAHQSADRLHAAEQHTAQALRLLAPGHTRNRVYYTILLAELQRDQGESEQAAATAATVPAGVDSSRLAARLTRLTAA